MIGTDQAFSDQQAHFFEKALEIEPDFAPALFNLGLIYLHQGKLDGALENLNRLIRIEPENDRAYSLRVEAHLGKEDLTSAQADIDQLKQLAPQNSSTWQESGRLHYRQDRMSEAVADFEKALELDPDDPDLHLDLALALDQTDRKELATQHYENFLVHSPGGLLEAQLSTGSQPDAAGRSSSGLYPISRLPGKLSEFPSRIWTRTWPTSCYGWIAWTKPRHS